LIVELLPVKGSKAGCDRENVLVVVVVVVLLVREAIDDETIEKRRYAPSRTRRHVSTPLPLTTATDTGN
jgi:hypothetical protein